MLRTIHLTGRVNRILKADRDMDAGCGACAMKARRTFFSFTSQKTVFAGLYGCIPHSGTNDQSTFGKSPGEEEPIPAVSGNARQPPADFGKSTVTMPLRKVLSPCFLCLGARSGSLTANKQEGESNDPNKRTVRCEPKRIAGKGSSNVRAAQ